MCNDMVVVNTPILIHVPSLLVLPLLILLTEACPPEFTRCPIAGHLGSVPAGLTYTMVAVTNSLTALTFRREET
jgi:hypothetical protein